MKEHADMQITRLAGKHTQGDQPRIGYFKKKLIKTLLLIIITISKHRRI